MKRLSGLMILAILATGSIGCKKSADSGPTPTSRSVEKRAKDELPKPPSGTN